VDNAIEWQQIFFLGSLLASLSLAFIVVISEAKAIKNSTLCLLGLGATTYMCWLRLRKSSNSILALAISFTTYLWYPYTVNQFFLSANIISAIGRSLGTDIKPKAAPYEDLKLNEDNIRLISIHPADERTPPLVLTLSCVALKSCEGKYIALSYSWKRDKREKKGDKKRKRECGRGKEEDKSCEVKPPVTIYGPNKKLMNIKIQANLRNALIQLRQDKNLWIWADAVCINQGDATEKALQFRRMFDIYKHAMKVIVWLGVEMDKSDEVMRALKEPDGALLKYNRQDYKNLEETMRYAIDRFLARRYWQRTWIVQEIAAGKEVFVYCGPHQIPWRNMRNLGLEWHFKTERLKMEKDMHYKHFPPVSLIREIRENWSPRYDQKKKLSLLQGLAKTSYAKATNTHDKVYALEGLVRFEEFYEQADIKKPTDDLCLEMTRQAIRRSGNIDIILLGPKVHYHSGLPSWCPDYFHFATDSPEDALVEYLSGEQTYRCGAKQSKWGTTMDSWYDTERLMSLKEDSRVLNVNGVYVGNITALGCTMSEDGRDLQPPPTSQIMEGIDDRTGPNQNLRDLLEKLLLFFVQTKDEKSLPPPQSTSPIKDSVDDVTSREWQGQYVHDVLEQLLLLYSPKYNDPPAYLSLLAGWPLRYGFLQLGLAKEATAREKTDHVWKWLHNNMQLSIHQHPLSYYTRTVEANRHRLNPITLYNLARGIIDDTLAPDVLLPIHTLLSEGLRLMAVSGSNQYIGLVHPRARLGDHVYLLQGCSMPIVLRRSSADKEFTVVGYAYVGGGVMEGHKWEATKQLDTISLI
jgi:hypothetical protein